MDESQNKSVELNFVENDEKHTYETGKKVWNISRLIKITENFKIQTMSMSALNTYGLTLNIVDLKSAAVSFKRVLDADLSYPIILDDEGYVMDGRHRIAKSLFREVKEIKFVRFDLTPDPCYERP